MTFILLGLVITLAVWIVLSQLNTKGDKIVIRQAIASYCGFVGFMLVLSLIIALLQNWRAS